MLWPFDFLGSSSEKLIENASPYCLWQRFVHSSLRNGDEEGKEIEGGEGYFELEKERKNTGDTKIVENSEKLKGKF